jgi:hypothetical protein
MNTAPNRCSRRWYEAAIEQQALGACVESFQGHAISFSLHGWHLSSNLRTFLARLTVPFSSSELDVRAPAHIQRCGQTPGCTQDVVQRWASKVSGEMISSYRNHSEGHR